MFDVWDVFMFFQHPILMADGIVVQCKTGACCLATFEGQADHTHVHVAI